MILWQKLHECGDQSTSAIAVHMGLRLSGEGCELQNLLTALESAHTRTYPGHILNYADDVSKPQ